MKSFVHKLKEKPDDIKNRIAIFAAISVTVLIVGLWFLVIKNKGTPSEASNASMRDDLKPLLMIFNGAKDGLSEMKKTDVTTNE